KAVDQPSEIRIRRDIRNRQYSGRVRIDVNIEIAQQRERAAAPAVIGIGREQRMIEQIVNVRANSRRNALAETKFFVDSEVQAPSAGSPKHVALDASAEHVCSNRRKPEGSSIPDCIAVLLVI